MSFFSYPKEVAATLLYRIRHRAIPAAGNGTKNIYLTIDDAPSADFLAKLGFLKRSHIPAIIFATGKDIEQNVSVMKHSVKQGFILGNHGYHHVRHSGMPIEQVRESIVKADDIIADIYKQAHIPLPIRLFRFPYGDRGGAQQAQIQKILADLGYKQPNFTGVSYPTFHRLGFAKGADCYWTVDIKEWKFKSLEAIKNHLGSGNKSTDNIGNLHNKSSSDIVLIHDHQNTTELFFEVMHLLMSMELKFSLPETQSISTTASRIQQTANDKYIGGP